MIKLRPYQEEGLDAIWNYFASGKTGNPVISWPTGVGKSVLPAAFISRIMKVWPTQTFMMITHVKELIEQNAEVLKLVWPNAPLGIYSAGLKSRDITFPIIYGGIQSAIKSPTIFGHRDIIFIDEAHLVNQEESSMYLTFIAAMKLINPRVKVIGMTATPFRMGQGYITDEGLFTDIIHDISGISGFNSLLANGYLAPLIPRRTNTELSVDGVGIRNNEYMPGQLQHAVDKEEITKNALKEAIEQGHDRKSWLIFSSGIEHAEHITSLLNSFNIPCAAVHSKQKSEYNDEAIKSFKNYTLRAICCYSKLTTGFNHPGIDLIIDLRPTMSIPLHIQKLGRGTRPAPGKKNCLVLDFSRNVPRLGPINDPIIPRKKGEKEGGDIPVKICEYCGAYNHISARVCDDCGKEFPIKVKIVAKPGNHAILRDANPIVETFDVNRVIYARHEKNGNFSLKVTYFCGMQMFREWIKLEYGGLSRKLAKDWWHRRHLSEPPSTIVEALKYTHELRVPKKIRVWVNKTYKDKNGRIKPTTEILSHEF